MARRGNQRGRGWVGGGVGVGGVGGEGGWREREEGRKEGMEGGREGRGVRERGGGGVVVVVLGRGKTIADWLGFDKLGIKPQAPFSMPTTRQETLKGSVGGVWGGGVVGLWGGGVGHAS